jgi:hypothetical protein
MTLMLAGTVFSFLLLFGLMHLWVLIIATVAVHCEHKIGIGRSFLSCFGVPSLIIIAIFLILEVL